MNFADDAHQHLPERQRQRIDRRVRHHQARRQRRGAEVAHVARLGRPLIGQRRRRHAEERVVALCAARRPSGRRSSSRSSSCPSRRPPTATPDRGSTPTAACASSSSIERIGWREKSTSMPNTASPRLVKPDLAELLVERRLDPAHDVEELFARLEQRPACAPRASSAPASGRRSRPPRRRAARGARGRAPSARRRRRRRGTTSCAARRCDSHLDLVARRP